MEDVNENIEQGNLDQGDGNRCDICARLGKDLPVRIGIGFKNQVKECPSHLTKNYPNLPDNLVYTLRLLETGYLYVYAEAWSHDHHKQGLEYPIRAYSISSNGYLSTIPLENIEDHEDVEKTHAICFETQESKKSKGYGDTTINALHLDLYVGVDEIGIIYSRHQFSKTVIKKLENRKDLFRIVSKNKIQHEYRLEKSQYTYIDDLANFDFEHSNSWIKDRDISKKNPLFKNQNKIFENLKNYYFDGDEKSIDYPVIVLDDPVGILKDIGQVMRYYKEKYNKNNEKDLFMDEKFSQIQLGVSRSCAASAYFEVEDYTKRGILANYKKGLLPNEMMYGLQGNKFKINNGLSKNELKNKLNDEKFDLLEILTPEAKEIFIRSINEKKDKDFKSNWKNYLEVVDENKYQKWTQSNAYKDLNSKIDNLSDAYIDFFKGDLFFHYMENYFDKENIEILGEFFNILGIVISDSVNYPKISEFFYELLKEKSISDRNYPLRALFYNNNKLKQYVSSNYSNFKLDTVDHFLIASAESIPSNAGLYYGYSQVLDEIDLANYFKLQNNLSHTVIGDRLHAQIALIFNEVGADLKNLPVAFGVQMFYEQELILVRYTGTLGKVPSEVYRAIQDSGIQRSDNKRERARALQSKLDRMILESNIKNPNKIVEFEFILDKKLYLSNRHNKTQNNVYKSISDFKLDPQFMNNKLKELHPNNNKALALGVLASALQSFAILTAYQKVRHESLSEKETLDAQLVIAAQPLILIGSIMDFAQRQIMLYQGFPDVKNIYTTHLASRFTSIRNLARIGLYGGAAIFAALEFRNAYNSLRNNNTTSFLLDTTYGVSLVLSTYLLRKGTAAISVRLLGLGATGWGILLIIIGFGLDYYADYVRRQQLRYWLKESYWGINNKEFTLDKLEKNYDMAVKEAMGE
jgi:hypothetical protein